MFSKIEDITKILTDKFTDFAVIPLGLYDVSALDNAKDCIMYVRDDNNGLIEIPYVKKNVPVSMKYNVKLVIQTTVDISDKILEAMHEIGATNIVISTNSSENVTKETGLKLKAEMSVLIVKFVYNYYHKWI